MSRDHGRSPDREGECGRSSGHRSCGRCGRGESSAGAVTPPLRASLPHREYRELGPRSAPRTVRTAAEVALDGLHADPEPHGDLVVARAAGEQPDRVELPRARPPRRVAQRPQRDVGNLLSCRDGDDRLDDRLDRARLGQIAGRATSNAARRKLGWSKPLTPAPWRSRAGPPAVRPPGRPAPRRPGQPRSQTTTSGDVASTRWMASSAADAVPTSRIGAILDRSADGRSDRGMVVDDDEADHRASVAWVPGRSKAMKTRNRSIPAIGRCVSASGGVRPRGCCGVSPRRARDRPRPRPLPRRVRSRSRRRPRPAPGLRLRASDRPPTRP